MKTTKMVFISYNEAIDAEVMEILGQTCALNNYTKIPGVFGKGNSSGTHMGDDIWPGRNNLLMVGCSESEARELLAAAQGLRSSLGKEGIKAFVTAVDAVTE
ncbi:MAG: PG0541 family transporter-associated protein [Candidatus Omnitrophota bacterium]